MPQANARGAAGALPALMGITMRDQPETFANEHEVRQALRDLVAEVALDLAKRAGGPDMLLEVAADLEAAALDLRTRFRRHAGR